jgi:hypothetical protein
MQPTADCSGAAEITSTKAAGDETFNERGECTIDTEHSPDEQPEANSTMPAEAAGPKVESELALKPTEKALEPRT